VILVPGFVRGDTSLITKAFGVQTFKGPRYAADLPTVLDSLGEVQLSTVVPACDLLREKEIWALDTATHSVRFVTHCDVDRAGCERALAALKEIVAKPQTARA